MNAEITSLDQRRKFNSVINYPRSMRNVLSLMPTMPMSLSIGDFATL